MNESFSIARVVRGHRQVLQDRLAGTHVPTMNLDIGASINLGIQNAGFIMENPIRMDDHWRCPYMSRN